MFPYSFRENKTIENKIINIFMQFDEWSSNVNNRNWLNM